MKNLSVFFPLYNEEGNVKPSVEKAIKILERLNLNYEIILVNDGSSDSTGKIADELAKNNSKIRAIHHPKNLGYGEALKSGFYNAKYETIVYTDGDGQFDFSEITKFLEKIEEYDLIIGYRIKRQDPFFRILFKKGWKLSLLLFFGLTIKDVDCGFKMIRKRVLEKIPHLESTRGAMINAELSIKAKKYGFKVEQVGVNHYPRLSGKPTGASINVIIKSYLDLLMLWWKLKDQKLLFLVLLAVLALAAFLRFYHLSQYMTFLGDEGRDALIVKKILIEHDFPLLGPPTSVGNIYLGPIYYYMMAFSMAVFWMNPVAAAGMNAFIGVLTVLLVYYLSKQWFGRISGLIAASLYVVSPITTIYSKSSWNPNPAPFFSLLAVIGIYHSAKFKDYRWLMLTGAALACALQMHYLALILVPIIVIAWFKEFTTKSGSHFWKGTIGGLLIFFLLMSPLVIFDLKHNFLNYRAVKALLFEGGTAITFNPLENITRVPSIYINNLVGRYISTENVFLAPLVALFILIPLLIKSYGTSFLRLWLLIGILGLTFYKGNIYDHYLGFLNPVPFILFGALFSISKNKYFKVGIGCLALVLFILNFSKSPIFSSAGNQLDRTQEVARFIIKQTDNKPFNFGLIAASNYDAAYQFYLDQYGHKPEQLPFTKTDQLFVVCEDEVCEPIYSSKFEIAAFGWRKVDKEWQLRGLKIYRIIHNPEEEKQ